MIYEEGSRWFATGGLFTQNQVNYVLKWLHTTVKSVFAWNIILILENV